MNNQYSRQAVDCCRTDLSFDKDKTFFYTQDDHVHILRCFSRVYQIVFLDISISISSNKENFFLVDRSTNIDLEEK